MKNKLIQASKIIFLGLLLSVSIAYATVWKGPTATPPGNNVEAPINVSATGQNKIGNLLLGIWPANWTVSGSGNLLAGGDIFGLNISSAKKVSSGSLADPARTTPAPVCADASGVLVLCGGTVTPAAKCTDPNSQQYNQTGSCTTCIPNYNMQGGICVQNAPTTCTDSTAVNNGGPLPCSYIKVYKSSGNFTVPSGVSQVSVFVRGAGGGGGGGIENPYDGNASCGAGGGGAGEYREGNVNGLTAGQSISVTVGGGGTKGVSLHMTGDPFADIYGNKGANGGQSSFGSAIIAKGGTGSGQTNTRTTWHNGTYDGTLIDIQNDGSGIDALYPGIGAPGGSGGSGGVSAGSGSSGANGGCISQANSGPSYFAGSGGKTDLGNIPSSSSFCSPALSSDASGSSRGSRTYCYDYGSGGQGGTAPNTGYNGQGGIVVVRWTK